MIECKGEGPVSKKLVIDSPSSKVSTNTLEEIYGAIGLGKMTLV